MRTRAASLASVELAASSLILALCAPLAGSLAIPETFRAIASFAWVAVVAGVGAPLLLFALIRKRGATQASSLLFVVPGITALGAWPILGTPIGPTALIGFAVAAFGLRLARASRRGSTLLDRNACRHARGSTRLLAGDRGVRS